MKDRLPFEIISEKSDMDWMAANPVTYNVEYKDFLTNEDKRKKAESLTKAGKLVLLKNGNEILGALVPKTALMVHGLLSGKTSDGFFDSINNRAFIKNMGEENGIDLLEMFDDKNQTVMVFDSQINPAYGSVSADFLKDNLVTDNKSNCLFKPDLRDAIESGLQNWQQNFKQAFVRIVEAQDKVSKDSNENPKDGMAFISQHYFINVIARYLNMVDMMIKEDKGQILSMVASDKMAGNEVKQGPEISNPY